MKNVNVKESRHGGNVWAASHKWGLHLDEILDFSANINPLGPSEESLSAIHNPARLMVHYPEPTGEALKDALGTYLGLDKIHLVLGNGGSELIYLLGRMFGQKRVIVVAPTFAGYGEGIEDPNLFTIPLNHKDQFGFPFQAIMDTMQSEDLLFLGNPNNPTGNLFPRQQLVETIYHAHAIGAMVVIDEAFIDFVENLSCSLRDIAAEIDNLIVVGSATKFFAMPGLRLGYAIASLPNVGKMERLLPSWRINSFACYAAMAALKDDNYIKQTRRLINTERDFLEVGLRNIPGLQVFSSKVNFVLVNSQATGSSAAELQERLGPKGILIRNCSNFDNLSPFYLRLAVRTRPENQRLLMALQEVVGTSKT